MSSYPQRFAVFQGQDCLVPPQIAAALRPSAAGALAQVVAPEAIAWPASMFPFELFADVAQGYSYSTFTFLNISYGAVLLSGNEEPFIKAAGLEHAAHFPVRGLASDFSSQLGRFVLLAKAHAHWADVSRFCGACGAPLVDANGNADVREPLDEHAHGARFCPRCKRLFFPRMSPAVIVLVRKGNSILLEHNVRFPGNRHSLVAGFVEMGETLEEAAAREIREEAGIEVKNLRYLRSQPWPFPDSLMLGFIAEWAGGEARPDGVEIDHVGWYTAEALPELPMKGSIARSIIDAFVAGQFSDSQPS